MDLKLSNLVVLNEGSIDVEASVLKFRNALTIAKASHDNDLETIATGVHAVYDQFPGAYIQIDALKSMVLSKLGVSPHAYGAVADRLHKFVQENTEAKDGKTASGADAIFLLKKGKGGGFARKADMAKPASA